MTVGYTDSLKSTAIKKTNPHAYPELPQPSHSSIPALSCVGKSIDTSPLLKAPEICGKPNGKINVATISEVCHG